MNHEKTAGFVIEADDLILITGAAGFIGARLVENLLRRGFRNLRCFARPSGRTTALDRLRNDYPASRIELLRGNLTSPEDCSLAAQRAKVIYHLAAGRGEKSFPDAFMNSVVTTRNLLEACVRHGCLQRFVNVSSFAVYTNTNKAKRRLLDETCPIENRAHIRGAYAFAKVWQDHIVREYGDRFRLPYVIVRPGYVYGPGKTAISGRVGTDTFGIFLHMGGSNPIPFTYVENCADAIALAGLIPGIDKEVFNIVDDDLPTSRQFLGRYKREVKPLKSIYLPHALSFLFCWMWEKYSAWSEGQLPPVFSVPEWHAYWKKTYYSNEKLKARLGWRPSYSTPKGLYLFFEGCREAIQS